MHIHYQKNPLSPLVCRECDRFDLKVISQLNIPKLFIEFKAHSSIDYPRFLGCDKKGISPMVNDILNMGRASKSNEEMYFIFFNNVIESSFPLPVSLGYKRAIAYYGLVKKDIGKSYSDK